MKQTPPPDRQPDAVITSWAAAAAPPPRLTVSQWADLRRRLPESSAARGGRWRTDAVPYLRGIMDAVHEIGTKKIVLMKCHQVGGSEALHNIIGYHIEYNPCAMLLVHPSKDVAEEWSKERLADMLRSTPEIGLIVSDKRQARNASGGSTESTLALKMFPGGYLALGGANTPNTFARRSVRIAMGDDVDRFPAVVGEEGDPADLLVNRTTSFYDGLSLFVSTPTLKNGRVDSLYQQSDRRRFFVPCPNCGRMDWITWSDLNHLHVAFDERDPETARVECPDDDHGGCGARLLEPDRRAAVAEGEWQPTATAKEFGLAGFHLPAMVSTLGSVELPTLVEKWLGARSKGKESLRVFINTTLAEGWEDRGAKVEPSLLYQRREQYGALSDESVIEVPQPAVALTAGVDVQENRFELQVLAWGPADERWVVDWRTIPGDPKRDETQEALVEALNRRYTHASGVLLPIHAVCVDTGYATEEMYDFVLAYQSKRIFATKGFGGKSGEPIVGKPSEKRYGRAPRPVRLYPINVDDAKAAVMNSLQLDSAGPGATHFPLHLETVNEEYFAQVCAEHRETRYNKQKIATHSVWVLDRDRNEGLDTMVLAIAAHRLLNPNIRQLTEAVKVAATEAAAASAQGQTTAPVPASQPKPRPSRTGRSGYLNR